MNKVRGGCRSLSKLTDWKDRSTCVLFGDGARRRRPRGVRTRGGDPCHLHEERRRALDLLLLPAGGSRKPATAETIANGDHFIKMKGDGVFKYALRAMEDAAHQALERANLTIDDVDVLVPHRRTSDHRRRSGPFENTRPQGRGEPRQVRQHVVATIPIAFDEAVRSGRVKKGDVVLFVAFGGGLTWGSVLFRYV